MSAFTARVLRLTATLLAAAALVACGDSLGEPCFTSGDCGGDTFCCGSDACSGGMCTIRCDDDRDCPEDMLCHDGDFCLFSCSSDRDCAAGFSCKRHGHRGFCEG